MAFKSHHQVQIRPVELSIELSIEHFSSHDYSLVLDKVHTFHPTSDEERNAKDQ